MAEQSRRTPIVIIGGGVAGGNAAATLREEAFSGPVVLISREPGIPFGRPPLSKTYLRSEEDLDAWYVRPAGWYAEHDVELRSGVAVAGVGIEPDVPAAAVAQENGILADELCRASAPDVYVAGDVANHLHPLFGRIRVEHFNNAEKQGAAAARSMLGSTAPYDYLHSFWSDQYQHKIEYVGHAARWDEFVVRGSLDEGKLVGFYLADGVVRAAVGLDRGGDPELDLDDEMAACAQLVSARARLAPAVLADERTDLWSLSQR